MSELFDLFSDPAATASVTTPVPVALMTDEQRSEIRQLFSELGLSSVREQFDLVDVLIGVRLRSVAELQTRPAALLIVRLKERVASQVRTTTGNAWADRDEDTWIDKL